MLRPSAPLTRLPASGGSVNGGAHGGPRRSRGPAAAARRHGGRLLALALLAAALDAAGAAPPAEDSPHRADAECRRCHTAERDALQRDAAAAQTLLAADLEARCIVCHGNEGPSHHTGIPPRTTVPATLPLSAEGLITCATCHWVHGEQNPFGDYVRIDNRRGGLCLTCHQLSELG